MTKFQVLIFTDLSYAQSFAERCQMFQASLENVQINIQEYVANGTNLTFPYNDPTCTPAYRSIYGGEFCRFGLNVTTSSASHIILEAWLPNDWNNRFASTGNGGLNGCIDYDKVAYLTSYGFAAVGANNGHNGTGGAPFLNNPEVVEDFAYRSVHTGVVIGKQLTEQFYSSVINHSYYLGCSTGGRQGMKSAQDFPNDFDGIVAGAPAFDFNHLISWSGWLSTVAGFDNSSDSFVTQSLWKLVNDEVLRQCDALDGVLDGIIEDPDLCHPRLESLLCAPNTTNTSTCLNSAQYARVSRAFEPLYNSSGTLIYPRLQPGAHAAAYPFLFAGQPFRYSRDWYRYVVYNNASWDAETLNLMDMARLDQLDPYNISTWKGDLSSFAARGGKILTYHGTQDFLISSENSARYYSHMAATMGLPPASIDEFYRYFRISGMGHCSGGPGASDIGQGYTGRAADISSRENNVLEAIVAWVEQGQAPEYLEGISWADGDANAGAEKFRRRHCRYPRRNVYVGLGDGTDRDDWQCIF